jgi:hypothetical protein
MRLAPCRPVNAISPTAYSPSRSVRAAQIGHHPAAGVVRRRHHRDRLPGHVEAVFQAFGVNVGKMGADEIGGLVADVQIHAFRAQSLHFMVNGTRHDIARAPVPAGVEIAA